MCVCAVYVESLELNIMSVILTIMVLLSKLLIEGVREGEGESERERGRGEEGGEGGR